MEAKMNIEDTLAFLDWLDGQGIVVSDEDLIVETLEEAGYKHAE
jgi:hypothetical protein